MDSSGIFEIDLFSPEIDSLDHPFVAQFRELLESLADEYNSRLLNFDIHDGTVIFSFDNDELSSKILGMLENENRS